MHYRFGKRHTKHLVLAWRVHYNHVMESAAPLFTTQDEVHRPWLNAYSPSVAWDAPLEARPVYALLDEAVAQWPHHVALDFLGKEYRYNQLGEMVDRVARGLQDRGIGKGSRVGLFMPNSPQFIIAYYAALKAGATVVNLNPLSSEAELAQQLADAQVELVFTLNLRLLYAKIAPFIGGGALKRAVIGQFQEAMPWSKRGLFAIAKMGELVSIAEDEQHIAMSRLLESPALSQPAPCDVHTDIAVLQYTGGTTGVPKAAALSHANLYVNAQQGTLWQANLRPGEETMLAVLPFFHVFAMSLVLNVGLYNGMRLIIHPRFDVKRILSDIHHKRPTFLPGVSTLYATINQYRKRDRYDLSSLNMCISGGGPLPVEVKERFEALSGCVVAEGYGLTEAAPFVACNPLDGVNKPGSIGLPMPGTVIDIIDKDDKETVLNTGEIGEICVRGLQVMQGYYRQEEETAGVLRDGRLHTGDLGYMDEDGYVFIVDRLKELIIMGGYNVYPRHIEEALYRHEAVAEAAVLGAEHPTRGQMIQAYVVMTEGRSVSEQTLRDYLRGELPDYAVPHQIVFRDELPKTPVGKILKKQLVAEKEESA